MNEKFINPYLLPCKYSDETHGRITSDIPKNIKTHWLSLDPIKGGQQTTINILLKKLFHELDLLGYHTASDINEVRTYIANVKLVDGRNLAATSGHGVPLARLVSASTAQNDGCATSGVGAQHTGETQQRTNLPSGVGKRSKGGSGKTNKSSKTTSQAS